MKQFLSKYGRHFWLLPLVISLYSWYDLLFHDEGDLFFPLFFSGFTYYFFLKGTGKLKDENDPFVKWRKRIINPHHQTKSDTVE